MNELIRQAENVHEEPTAIAGLDAQLLELIEFVWACEGGGPARSCIDAAIGLQVKAITWGGG
jgi:hypothetical protein